MASQAQNPLLPGAQTQHRIDSGVCMPAPKYARYQYYSQNSLKERRRILAKYERELARKIDMMGFVSTESVPSMHPFHGLRTVCERRGYWNTLPTYSGSSLPRLPATPEGKKKRKKKKKKNDVSMAFTGDVREKIGHSDRLSLGSGWSGEEEEEEEGGSFRAESVTTFNSAATQDRDRRVVSPESAVWTIEDGKYVDRRVGTPHMSIPTLDTPTDGAYGSKSTRAVVRDGDERPIIIVPHDKAKREGKSSLLNGLLRRPGESRVPRATVPVPVPVPSRFNVKSFWVKKEVLEFELQERGKMERSGSSGEKMASKALAAEKMASKALAVEKTASKTLAVEKTASKTLAVENRLPTLSHHSRAPGCSNGASIPLPILSHCKRGLGSSIAPLTNGLAASPSNTADRRLPTLQYHSRTLLSRPSNTTSRSPTVVAKSQRPRISDAASCEEPMRYTTLDDLPLGEGGAKRISQLMREVEEDRYGTWPQPKAKCAVADDEIERHTSPMQQIPSESKITEQVQKRLAQLDDEAARQCEEERAQRRQEEEQRRRLEDRAQTRRRDERGQRRREETGSSTISAREMVIPPFRPAAPSRPAPPAHQSPPVHPVPQAHAAPQINPSPPPSPPPHHRPSSPSSPLNVLLAKLDGPPASPRPRHPQSTYHPNLKIPPFVPPAVNPYLDAERPPTRRTKPRRRSRHAGYVDSSGTLKPVAGSSLRHVVSAESVASGMESISEGVEGDVRVAEEEEADHPFSPVTVEGASWRDV